MKRSGIAASGGLKRSPMTAGRSELKRTAMAASSTPMKRTQMAAGTSTMKRTQMAASTATMKRSQMAPSSEPMRRSSPMLQRAPIERGTTALTTTYSMKRSWIKVELPAAGVMAPRRRLRSKGPKMTPIRKSAKGEACTLLIPGVCRNRTDTTVWAHSNRLADGKGTGHKADDEAGCYACFDCHSFLDGGWAAFRGWTYDLVQQFFEVARAKSRAILQRKGLIQNDQQQAK